MPQSLHFSPELYVYKSTHTLPALFLLKLCFFSISYSNYDTETLNTAAILASTWRKHTHRHIFNAVRSVGAFIMLMQEVMLLK